MKQNTIWDIICRFNRYLLNILDNFVELSLSGGGREKEGRGGGRGREGGGGRGHLGQAWGHHFQLLRRRYVNVQDEETTIRILFRDFFVQSNRVHDINIILWDTTTICCCDWSDAASLCTFHELDMLASLLTPSNRQSRNENPMKRPREPPTVPTIPLKL